MSHVDEGALHAYLDGALDEYPAAEARRVREHLETCAVCAERLAEERRVRDEASAILDLAAPKVEVPTFEELRAYVRAARSPRSTLGRLHKMGWAASVVLALGTGWFLRGGVIDPMRTYRAQEAEPAADRVQSVTRPADDVTAETTSSVVSDEPAAASGSVPVQAPQLPAASVAAPPPARTLADAPAAAGAPAAARRAESVGVPMTATADGPPAPAPSPAAEPEVEKTVVADADALAGAAPVAAGAAAFDDRQADAVLAQQRLDSAARAMETRLRISADQVVTSTIDAAPAPTLQRGRGNEVERDRSQNEEGESLVVPGLEVLAVENLGEGTVFAGTRSLQRLASGDTLEVIHLPEGVEPGLLAPPRAGRNQVVRQHPDGWLVLRAPLAPVELEQLLERLEAGR